MLATGKDLAALRQELRPRLRATLAEAARGLTRTGLRGWDIGTLPGCSPRPGPGLPGAGRRGRLGGRPAGRHRGRGRRGDAPGHPPAGAVAGAVRAARGRRAGCRPAAKLAMSRHPYRSTGALLDDCAAAAADQIIAEAGGPAWDAAGFAPAAGRGPGPAGRGHRGRGPGSPRCSPRRTRPRPAWAADLPGAGRGDRRHAPPAGRADPPGVRRRDRRRGGCPTWSATCGPSTGGWRSCPPTRAVTPSGWPPCTGSPRTTAGPGRPAARPAVQPGRPGGALDDRGAAGQPVRPDAGHRRARYPSSASTGPGPAARLDGVPGPDRDDRIGSGR